MHLDLLSDLETRSDIALKRQAVQILPVHPRALENLEPLSVLAEFFKVEKMYRCQRWSQNELGATGSLWHQASLLRPLQSSPTQGLHFYSSFPYPPPTLSPNQWDSMLYQSASS